MPPDEPVREVGKPFEQPPLGRPKRGTRVQSDQKPPTLKAQRFEPFFRPLLLSVGNDQPDALNGLGLFNQPGAEQELQVIARLMSIGSRRRLPMDINRAITCSSCSAPDRKSTRLNSSHL